MCSKFYSLVLSCTATPPQLHKRAKRRVCGVHRVRVRWGASAPHRADLGGYCEWIKFDSLFRFYHPRVNQFWFTLAVRVRISHSSSVLRLSYTHILSWFFLLPCVTLSNTLSGGRKKSPENLTDLVRPSGLFLYFLCFIRVQGYTFPANLDVNSIKIK